MDWHEVSIVLSSLLFAIGGFVWMQALGQVTKLSDKLDAHIEQDRLGFESVHNRITAVAISVASLDGRVDQRFIARDDQHRDN